MGWVWWIYLSANLHPTWPTLKNILTIQLNPPTLITNPTRWIGLDRVDFDRSAGWLHTQQVFYSFLNAPHLNEDISFIDFSKKARKKLKESLRFEKKKLIILKIIKLFLKHGYLVFSFLTFIIILILNFRKRNIMSTIFS